MLGWHRRAAHHADAINRHLLRDLPVTHVQLDEMWNFIERKHTCETDAARENGPGSEDGRQWVWVSFATEFRLMIAAIVGPRTLDTANSWRRAVCRSHRACEKRRRLLRVECSA